MKKLYRSKTEKVIGGVLGGLAEYYDKDPALFRIIWVILSVFVLGLPALLIYTIAYIIIPVAK